jgi:zinc transport system ATP-binding protein
MKEKALLVNSLEFKYDGTSALEGVNIEVDSGEFVGIFGPNGGGKTTLLKILLGLLPLQKGSVRLFGHLPAEARHLVGYVPQALQFDKDFPIGVLDVVMMGALRRLDWLGRYPADVKEKAWSALKKVGLEHKAAAAFGTLSGGEAQRALIARAILDNPRLLVLDEPTSNIDPQGGQTILDLLSELNRSMTILMVTHDLQTIVDKVGKLLCVQKRVTSLRAKEVCEHFALGLYHTPLTSTNHFSLK